MAASVMYLRMAKVTSYTGGEDHLTSPELPSLVYQDNIKVPLAGELGLQSPQELPSTIATPADVVLRLSPRKKWGHERDAEKKGGTTFHVTRTQISDPAKSALLQRRQRRQAAEEAASEDGTASATCLRNDYLRSVAENKNEYWRRMCWCEVQKKRRSPVAAVELRTRFERYDRWERKNFRQVDWKTFYDEMRASTGAVRLDQWVGDMRLHAALFIVMFAFFYVLVVSL